MELLVFHASQRGIEQVACTVKYRKKTREEIQRKKQKKKKNKKKQTEQHIR